MVEMSDWHSFNGRPFTVAKDHVILDENALAENDVYRGAVLHLFFPAKQLRMAARITSYIGSTREAKIRAPTVDGFWPWVPDVWDRAQIDATYAIEPSASEPMTSDVIAGAVLDARWDDHLAQGSVLHELQKRLTGLESGVTIAAERAEGADEQVATLGVAIQELAAALQGIEQKIDGLGRRLPPKLVDGRMDATSYDLRHPGVLAQQGNMLDIAKALIEMKGHVEKIEARLPPELVEGRILAYVEIVAADAITGTSIDKQALNRIADHVLRRGSGDAFASVYGDKPHYRSLLGVVADHTHEVAEGVEKREISGPDPKKPPFGVQMLTRDGQGNILKRGDGK